ncbi:unnamed protein product, partial [Cyprideis torosa]
VHTNERPFECHICFKRFTSSGDLKKHTRIHTGERPYQCLQCPSAFVESGTLKKHLRSHTGETPFECDLCGKQFTQSSHVLRHKKKIHVILVLHSVRLALFRACRCSNRVLLPVLL